MSEFQRKRVIVYPPELPCGEFCQFSSSSAEHSVRHPSCLPDPPRWTTTAVATSRPCAICAALVRAAEFARNGQPGKPSPSARQCPWRACTFAVTLRIKPGGA